MNLIDVSHLHRAFGLVNAVDDLSLQVANGEIYGLVGPDGAGKTTVMRLICGAYKPTLRDGFAMPQIRIAGYDLQKHLDQAREQIGYLPQRFSLYEELSVLENIRFLAEVRGVPAAEWRPRCMEILEFVGLDGYLDRRAGYLSGGMRQKLGLAAALVHRPRVLLLDEPTTGVDPVTRQDFWQLIIRLVAQNSHSEFGTAVLVSTPYMDEAIRCTRVGFMSRGRLVVEGAPSQLLLSLQGRIMELGGTPLSLLRRIVEGDDEVEAVQMFGDRLHLRVQAGTADRVTKKLRNRIANQGGQIDYLRPAAPQLEDVFIDLVEAQI